jgi:hypothetical protein
VSFRATVDRIEDGVAILLPGQDERSPLSIPIGFLPKNCREGDIVSISIDIDEKATEDTKRRVDWLLGELDKQQKRR